MRNLEYGVAFAFFLVFILIIAASAPPPNEEKKQRLLCGINYMNATAYDAATQRFKDDDLTRVSLRVYWNTVETSRGSYSATGVTKVKNLVAAFGADDLDVDITFWTQFQSGAEDPQWVKRLSGYNPYFKATNETVKQAFIAWVVYMVAQLKGYSNIESWNIMNEPFYASSTQRSGFVDLIEREVAAIRAEDNTRIVLCRFTPLYSPAGGKYPDSLYDLFDVFGITVYNHPDTYHLADYRTDPAIYNCKWWMYKDSITDCAARGLPVWVIEFGAAAYDAGYGALSEEEQRQHYEDVLTIFDNDSVERAYAWVWRHTQSSSEPFSLWNGYRTVSAYDELLNYLDAPPTPPTYYKAFTADGNLQGIGTYEFTNNAHLLDHNVKTLTANAVLLVPPEVEPVPKTFTVGAVLEGGYTKTFTNDAVLKTADDPDAPHEYPEPDPSPYGSALFAKALKKVENTPTTRKMVVI